MYKQSIFLTIMCFCVLIIALLYAEIGDSNKMDNEGLSPLDPSSFSRPELAVVTKIFLSLDVNFDKKTLSGHADLIVNKIDKNIDEVILDAKDLKIQSIHETDLNKSLLYELSDPVGEFGSKLTVKLPEKDVNNYKLRLRYETSEESSGLQWLTPEQTAGKVHPFVFSQFQAIHARSVIPCQDTPSVKSKYSANIYAPKQLTVVMSAILAEKKSIEEKTMYHFIQDVPVPTYLIAIAVGALESRKLGPRSHVWAEKEIVEEAKYEFAETEHQLKTAEDICGPYVWGIYDLLVLPPSFPFGGMENPCLTFVTPTLLAGDRSLVNVVAHEIAHSWTGNLITNCNFEHFWLNEGFTVFVERKILGKLASPQLQDFQALCAVSELQETVNRIGKDNPLTSLVQNLRGGVSPDDAFSTVPYEKGQTFLRYLESTVGGPEKFEPFLKEYFDHFKYKSVCTDDFKNFFETYFANTTSIKNIDWNTWLNSPGMPPVIPDYDKTLATVCDDLLERIDQWNDLKSSAVTTDDVKNLSTEQIIYLLQKILDGPPQSIEKLKKLQNVLNLEDVKNAEKKYRWLRIGIKAKWEEKIEPALNWITEVGRMKYVRPLYRDLYNWELARPKAVAVYNANKNKMMHVVAYTVGHDLRLR